jgi:hypothetical protein
MRIVAAAITARCGTSLTMREVPDPAGTCAMTHQMAWRSG